MVVRDQIAVGDCSQQITLSIKRYTGLPPFDIHSAHL